MLSQTASLAKPTVTPAKRAQRPVLCSQAQAHTEGQVKQTAQASRRQVHKALGTALLLAVAPAGPSTAQPAALQDVLPQVVPRGPLSDR